MGQSTPFHQNYILNDIQKEVLTGLMLGDGSLNEGTKSSRLSVTRAIKDLKYLEWQYNIFKDLFNQEVNIFDRYDKRYDKTHTYCGFRTRAIPAFLEFHNKWYPIDKKIVPEDLVLTDRIVATWFADDGHAGGKGNSIRMKFSTESFGKVYCEFLKKKLEDFYKDDGFFIYPKDESKDQWLVKAKVSAARKLAVAITPYLLEMGIERKAMIWKHVDFNTDPIVGQPIRNIKNLSIGILELNDFYLDDLYKKMINYPCHYQGVVNRLVDKGYLTKYKPILKEKFFKYRVTNLGFEFFTKEINYNFISNF